ncbi:hypothetical protein ABK040_007185 [Willaertia magna]
MILLQTFVSEHHVCPKHSSNVLKVLCKPCKVLICGECSFLSPHDNHEKVHVSQIIEKEREETLNLIMELKDKVNNMNERKEKVELTISNVNKRLQQITKEIDDSCNEIIGAVEERRKELMKKAQLIHNERETKLKNESLQLKDLMQNVDKLCQSIFKSNQPTANQVNRKELEQKLKETNDIDVILNKLSLEKGKQNIKEMQQTNELQSFLEFELMIQKDKEQIINLINNQLGDIVDYSIDIDKCYITNFNEIKQGLSIYKKDLKITLQLLNKKNEKVTNNYNCNVIAFLSKSKEVLMIDDSKTELKSINNKNGTFDFELSNNLLKFDIKSPYLHVQIDDKSIKNFPFQLNITRDCLFDSNYCGNKGQLLNDNKRFKRGNDGNGWSCGVLGTSDCFRYKIKLLNNCTDLMVGFALKTTFDKNSINYNRNGGGWYLYCNGGTLYSSTVNYSCKAYVKKSCNNNGTIIEAIFTPETKSISFIVDGTNYGISYENIHVPDLNELSPAFDTYNGGCEFELIK